MNAIHLKKVVATLIVVIIAGYGIYVNQKKETLSEIMIENIEALADNESDYEKDCTRYLGCTTGTMERCGNAMLVMSFIHTFGCDYGGTFCNPRTEINYYDCDRNLTGTEITPSFGLCY